MQTQNITDDLEFEGVLAAADIPEIDEPDSIDDVVAEEFNYQQSGRYFCQSF
jgi:hypothetical protein